MEGLSLLRGPSGPKAEADPSWPAVPSNFNHEHVGNALSEFQRPVRIEGEIYNLEVEGEIPKEIAGTFYRIMPDPAFPPYIKNDVWINGDGMVSSFRIQNGHVDFNQRYVETDKLKIEREHRRSLNGRYRNPFTDAYSFKNRTVANTTVFAYRDKMLALKEDGPAYAMNPKTLETYGVYDFEGQWKSQTFTAHPKYDAHTRELLTFGYEAKGLGTKDNYYACFDKDGKMTEEVWFTAPVCGFQHEMAITENWVLFPITPMINDFEAMKAGGNHWEWNPKQCYYIGVLPRRGGKASDVKWFWGDNNYVAHVSNSYEEDGKIHLHMCHALGNVMGFFPEKGGNPKAWAPGTSRLCHFVLDPHSDDLYLPDPEVLIAKDNEMPRVDDRYMGYKTRYAFGAMNDKEPGKTDWTLVGKKIGGGFPPFNTIYRHDLQTGTTALFWNGDYRLYQEPVFIPRYEKAPESDGWLIALTMNYQEMISELVIVDAVSLQQVALCRLPLRLRMGIHGNWVDDTDIDGHAAPSKGADGHINGQ